MVIRIRWWCRRTSRARGHVPSAEGRRRGLVGDYRLGGRAAARRGAGARLASSSALALVSGMLGVAFGARRGRREARREREGVVIANLDEVREAVSVLDAIPSTSLVYFLLIVKYL